MSSTPFLTGCVPPGWPPFSAPWLIITAGPVAILFSGDRVAATIVPSSLSLSRRHLPHRHSCTGVCLRPRRRPHPSRSVVLGLHHGSDELQRLPVGCPVPSTRWRAASILRTIFCSPVLASGETPPWLLRAETYLERVCPRHIRSCFRCRGIFRVLAAGRVQRQRFRLGVENRKRHYYPDCVRAGHARLLHVDAGCVFHVKTCAPAPASHVNWED